MATPIGNVFVGVKLDYAPILDQLGLVEIVAKMRYDEWARGWKDGTGEVLPPWEACNQAAWISTAREALKAAMR